MRCRKGNEGGRMAEEAEGRFVDILFSHNDLITHVKLQ